MKNTKNKKIDLLNGNILSNLIKLAAPLMATAFIQITYNFTDMIWVGRLGSDAVAAVGLSSFFTWIAAEFALVPRVGGAIKAAHYFGSNNKDILYKTIKNAIYLTVFIAIIYFTIIQVLAKNLVAFYELEYTVSQMGESYLRIVACGFFVVFINPVFSSLYNSLGDSVTPFKLNAVGLIINVLLDPLFIFGFGPFPKLGIQGAAIATVLAQVIVAILFIVDSFKTNNEIYISFKFSTFDIKSIKEICQLGVPAGAQGILHACISTILSKFMARYGTKAIAVYSVGSLIESITWMSTEGFQTGIVAFVGQNFGAKQYDRLKVVIKKCLKIVSLIGLAGSTILILFRFPIYKIFLPQDIEAQSLGANYLLILGFSQFFMAIEIGATGVFQGLGRSKIPSVNSIFLNLLRIPISLLLMPIFGVYGVWMALTITSIFKGIVLNIILFLNLRNSKYIKA